MEAAAAKEKGLDVTAEPFLKPVRGNGEASKVRPKLDEDASPVTGRRFTRA
jgi:hypothetical protein